MLNADSLLEKHAVARLPMLSEPFMVREQILAALRDVEPSCRLQELAADERFARVVPELAKLITTPQDPIHHPEGNVWSHTLLVVAEAVKIAEGRAPRQQELSDDDRTALLLGTLLHDVGKGEPGVTKSYSDKSDPALTRFSAHDHEKLGVSPAKSILDRLGLMEYRASVLAIVEHHMRFPFLCRAVADGLMRDQRCHNRMKTFIRRDLNGMEPLLLLYASVADWRGRGTGATAARRESFVDSLSERFLRAYYDCAADP